MEKLTRGIVETWLAGIEANRSFHYKEACSGQVAPESWATLRKIFYDLTREGIISSCGKRDGYYYKVEVIKPIRNIEGGGIDYIDFRFPKSHGGDDTSFGLEDLIAVSPGDLIVIAGVPNAGKTCFVLNLLAENIGFSNGCVLMGNEYVTADKAVAPRFRRRLRKVDWASLVDGNGQLNFDLLPVKINFEDHIQKDKINLIDWIMMPDNFWGIQKIHDGIKEHIGQGVAAVVMQKSRGKDYGDGGEFSERLADVYFTIDPFGEWESLLSVGKVKEPKGKVTGRSWRFKIINSGSGLHDIQEVKKCQTCHGKKWVYNKPCEACDGKGYIDLEDLPF